MINSIQSSASERYIPYSGTSAKSEASDPATGKDRQTQDKEAVKAQGAEKNPGKELTEQEKQQVRELQKTDQEVKAHEQAHIAAGAGYVRSGASYTYEVGPDGKRYAVGGEVSIDTSAVPDDPQATITKMQAVRRAAMAPANPSGQDRQVAAQAQQTAAQAQAEIAQKGPDGAKGKAPAENGKNETDKDGTASGKAENKPSETQKPYPAQNTAETPVPETAVPISGNNGQQEQQPSLPALSEQQTPESIAPQLNTAGIGSGRQSSPTAAAAGSAAAALIAAAASVQTGMPAAAPSIDIRV